MYFGTIGIPIQQLSSFLTFNLPVQYQKRAKSLKASFLCIVAQISQIPCIIGVLVLHLSALEDNTAISGAEQSHAKPSSTNHFKITPTSTEKADSLPLSN